MGHALSCLAPPAASFPSDAQSVARELTALARDGNHHRLQVCVAYPDIYVPHRVTATSNLGDLAPTRFWVSTPVSPSARFPGARRGHQPHVTGLS